MLLTLVAFKKKSSLLVSSIDLNKKKITVLKIFIYKVGVYSGGNCSHRKLREG